MGERERERVRWRERSRVMDGTRDPLRMAETWSRRRSVSTKIGLYISFSLFLSTVFVYGCEGVWYTIERNNNHITIVTAEPIPGYYSFPSCSNVGSKSQARFSSLVPCHQVKPLIEKERLPASRGAHGRSYLSRGGRGTKIHSCREGEREIRFRFGQLERLIDLFRSYKGWNLQLLAR